MRKAGIFDLQDVQCQKLFALLLKPEVHILQMVQPTSLLAGVAVLS